jgi:hypothetical protein
MRTGALLLQILIAVNHVVSPVSAEWRIETIADSGAGVSQTSLALDRKGLPYISYMGVVDFPLNLAHRNWTGWLGEVVDADPGTGWSSSLVMDGSDHIHVSYYGKTDRILKYATNQSGAWRVEIVDDYGWTGHGNDMFIDSDNRPHISYLLDHPEIDVKYAFGDDDGWIIERVGDEEYFGRATSISMNSQGDICIAFLFSWTLYYLCETDSGWHEEIAFDDALRAMSTSMTLDADDYPHICHTGITYSGEDQIFNIFYTWKSAFGWQTETIDSFPYENLDHQGWQVSMALDDAGEPHVAYFNGDSPGLIYGYRENVTWHTESIVSGMLAGYSASLALDMSGYPHISYLDLSLNKLNYATTASYPSYLGVDLDMPRYVSPGDPFGVTGYLLNPHESMPDIPVFFILDVLGSYWFWPGWRAYEPGDSNAIDYMIMDVPPGVTAVAVIPDNTWPDTGSAAMDGLRFYGAMLTASMNEIIGEMAVVTWGFHP